MQPCISRDTFDTGIVALCRLDRHADRLLGQENADAGRRIRGKCLLKCASYLSCGIGGIGLNRYAVDGGVTVVSA